MPVSQMYNIWSHMHREVPPPAAPGGASIAMEVAWAVAGIAAGVAARFGTGGPGSGMTVSACGPPAATSFVCITLHC